MIAQQLTRLQVQGKCLILPHDNPDPDGMAAAWALSFFLERTRGLKPEIGYCGLIGRAENRAMVQELKIPLESLGPADFGEYSTVVMVDCQPHTGNSCLPDEIMPDAVIDHHPKRTGTRVKQWAYIDPKMGATSTILAATLEREKIPIPKALATALFYAIRSETKDLGWEGTRKDYRAYVNLLPKIDFDALYRIEHPRLPPHYYRMLKRAIHRSRIYGFLVVCPLGKVPYPELPAEIADFLIFHQDVDLALVTGVFENNLYLSLRSFHRLLDSGEIMRDLVHGRGTGGGHEIMAGGKIPAGSSARAQAEEQEVRRRILKRFALDHRPAKKLDLTDA
jgi:nanoRNase/pAp phosphatase (c-di-AMP/oligoRNAs hydrolase)